MKNINRSESTTCQNCGKMITWRDSDDQFNGVIFKLFGNLKDYTYICNYENCQ